MLHVTLVYVGGQAPLFIVPVLFATLLVLEFLPVHWALGILGTGNKEHGKEVYVRVLRLTLSTAGGIDPLIRL
jgi:hypothetical protein